MDCAAQFGLKLVDEADWAAASAEHPGKVIELEAVRVRFGLGRSAMAALDEITFDARKGECISLLAPSGRGKYGILRLVGGLARPTSGCCRGPGGPA